MEKKGASNMLHMRGGTGSGSYNEFSKSLQSTVNGFFWPKLALAIANTCKKFQPFADDGTACFAIADFGCSCALNTINSMNFIAQSVAKQASMLALGQAPKLDSPAKQRQFHVQAFFNDLPSNDFNTLFALLSYSHGSATKAEFHFMPCGLPGSFYSSLFPGRYLHIGLCTLALHNLSQVPDAVQDPRSSAWNENGTWILEGCKPETAAAYKRQFAKDFTCFLRHRSQELVPGGLLFCVMIASSIDGTSTSLPKRDHHQLQTNLQIAWRQLVSEGLLEQESLDTFNMPLFTPTMDEVKEVTAAADAQTWGRTCEMMVRNFVGSLIQPHLGLAKFELLMERFRHLAAADDEVYRSSLMRLIVLALSRR
ncbi:hypothetical protein GOP47_0024774 [Adiantum capillus-veneris]|uniref:Uncharacterized protein n=1 Tax=Adiantum capillus-veneris TaxID=13818 RepID=A0A9D4Z3Y4_ADICA|nr:hypothetical protein GOP47_0024774 [Adiantum capillus-veneris]